MSVSLSPILQQIDQALDEWRQLRAGSKWDDCSDKPEHEAVSVITRLASTIDRLAPPNSHHKRNLQSIFETRGRSYAAIPVLVGALLALRKDYELGHLQTFEQLVHAETSASFIEMAEDLHTKGYKDAAAVIAGSVLEQHLRDLCSGAKIEIDSNGKYKKADALNSELVGQGIYNKLDQKNVTSWLGLRNDAAHGNYSSYTMVQVKLMIDSVRDFMTRHAA
jgi:hypothetical protein